MSLPSLPRLPEIEEPKEKVKKERPKMPKSEYDSDGNPILTIPDLDDINLNKEINKYFGELEEDD